MPNQSENSRIVYSTEAGHVCALCGQVKSKCTCRKKAHHSKGDGVVRVQRESKGRHGKTVTAIRGIPLEDSGLRKLATELKQRCGTGGSVKEGVILIQGDHRDTLVDELKKLGYTAKPSGG